LMEYHNGDAELAIPSYNRGQGYIRRLFESTYVNGDKDEFFREIDALETREYLQRVTVNLETYRALYEGDPLALESTTTEQGATEN
jgi:soluble lytic murein transglycosylase-like protein